MKKLAGLLVLCLAAACADIDEALEKRRRDAGADAGEVGGGSGGGAMGGGGGATGGGGGGGGDGGTGDRLCFNGFCWENPLPQGNRLNAVWSNDDGGAVWLVGETGTAFRWTARGWENFQDRFPPNEELTSIWGAGNELWVVGMRDTDLGGPSFMNPMHFDGDAWNAETFSGADPELLSIRGRDLNEIWASGLSGAIARRNPGGTWSARTFEQRPDAGDVALSAIAFAADGHCVVALRADLNGIAPCDGGALELKLDGLDGSYTINALWPTSTGSLRAAATTTLNDLSSRGNLWLRGADGGWDSDFTDTGGQSCTAGTTDLAYCGNQVVAVNEPPAALTLGVSEIDTTISLLGAWTPGAAEGSWLVGQAGAIYRYTSNQWTAMRLGSTDTVFALWVDDQRVLGVGSSNSAFTREPDSSWSRAGIAEGRGETRDLWVSPNDDYRAYVGVERMLVDGPPASMTKPLEVPLGSAQLNGLWGLSSNDLWAVGTPGELWHRVNGTWSSTTLFTGSPPDLWDIDGTADGGAFIVGSDCTVLRRAVTDDGGWVSMGPGASLCTGAPLFGVWAAGPNDAGLEVVAVGPASATYFRRNGVWSTVNPNAPANLFKVWGTSPSDIWAVGVFGTLVHYDGARWSRVLTGTRATLESVRGRDAGAGKIELFIAGENGAVLRRIVP